MSINFALDAQPRSVVGKQVKHLRTAGILPATVYGKSFDPVSVQLDEKAFFQVYRKAGRSTLIELSIAGHETQPVYVKEVQRHPVTKVISHADFLVVDLKVEMTTTIPIYTVGDTPEAVERNQAIVNHALSELEVKGLPSNLPSYIEVDISNLTLDTSIFVRDLAEATNYEVLSDPDEVVVSLAATRMARSLEEDAAADEAGAAGGLPAPEPEVGGEDAE
jgi:large subunit ribosomal protein L25